MKKLMKPGPAISVFATSVVRAASPRRSSRRARADSCARPWRGASRRWSRSRRARRRACARSRDPATAPSPSVPAGSAASASVTSFSTRFFKARESLSIAACSQLPPGRRRATSAASADARSRDLGDPLGRGRPAAPPRSGDSTSSCARCRPARRAIAAGAGPRIADVRRAPAGARFRPRAGSRTPPRACGESARSSARCEYGGQPAARRSSSASAAKPS